MTTTVVNDASPGGGSCLTLEGAYDQVRSKFLFHHPDGDTALLDRAFKVGKKMHATQKRKSGEPYFFHPLAVADSLAEWRLDAVSVACAILHDTVEDTLMTIEEVRKQFGEEVADIVDGLTKMSKLSFTDRTLLNAENVRKLLVAMGKDVRVLLVKLADRLHNMRTLASMREEKRRRIARETLELYAPLANRLGMGTVRAELEDLAFANLEPERFAEMRKVIDQKRSKSAPMVEEIKKTLQSALRAQGIHAEILYREKHLYGIWKKMGLQEKSLDDIHDWLAYRILCPDRASCYTAMGLVHALYKPIPGRFKDYISLPKDNGYQSIHTSVLMPGGDSFEVQFRTQDMDDHAEAGIAAHWTYKEGKIANKQEINQASFLRRMVELHQESRDSRDLVANLKGELSFQRIQVFTPKGDLRSLPENSTPIDFAYSIHTEVGHHCVGAKVNGRMVPLRHPLQNGDRVEIFTRADHKPSRDWLSVVVSAGAKAKIQTYIREEERAHAILIGKERLDREARTLGIRLDAPESHVALEARLKELKIPSWDAFYAQVGFNRITCRKLLEPLVPEASKAAKEEKPPEVFHDTVLVDDNVGILYSLAVCCKPIWGDEIVGYTTRGRGISIHRANCPHLSSSAPNPERLVSVAWGKASKGLFNTELVVTTEDRPGMVASISNAIQKAGHNMQRFSGSSSEEGGGVFYIALRVKDRNHIVELMGTIRKLKGVFTVDRVRGSYFGTIK
ncbi:bifunctional (p)ppGpp synthetase/guanosine-3',5'-bis(diphosphate) 3'-pyrophosphohydrolase [Geothrix sp. 21YS21S-2]|uniref:RelA/SpoT family protein n=1 Tax=Geothrix sp. 21YS21S-2 TaxID=3068893 RepID=UPI0027B9007D|nr:bifunctional (p)ppGpp synthetase/guanosine-3',5'-bis(diphosphate) 3'-pyrophosphohydrolase [Geothrix sp. 21YS21S-2]